MRWETQNKFWLFDDPRSYGARQLMLGAANGLRHNGKEVHVHHFNTQSPNADLELKESLIAFNPDVVLLANHPSTLFWQNIQCEPLNCMVIIWVFDDPFIMGAELFDAKDIVWIADPSFAHGAILRGANNPLFVPVAAPCEMDPEIKPQYQIPLAYVGATFRIHKAREQIGEPLADYLDQIIDCKIHYPDRSFESLLEAYLFRGTGKVKWSGQLAYYLYTEINRRHRLHYLHALVDLGLHLYGNDAWLPEIEGSALQPFFHGSIEPLVEYPSLIRSASINLNIRSMQGIAAPVQRDFLMPAAGGFMLSSQQVQSGMDWQLWDAGSRYQLNDFVWSPSFQSVEEAVALVQFYTANQRVRLEWIDQARQCIHNHHTFAHRIEQAGKRMNEVWNETNE